MSRALTTLIDLTLDHKAISTKFALYRVKTSKTSGKPNYGATLSLIDREVSPKALISHSGDYWILVDQHDKPNSSSREISFEQVQIEEIDNSLLLGRLMIRALGKVAGGEFFSGLAQTYFLIELDTFFDHTIYKCVEFELHDSIRFGSLFIVMSGRVFSPLEAVSKPKGIIERAPKFEIDRETGILRKNPKGTLIQASPGPKNYRTKAIDISGSKPIALQKTRTGAIYQFVELMNRCFSGMLKIELKAIEADWRQHYTKKDIEVVYQRIYKIIDSAGGIQVLNASMTINGVRKLESVTWPVNVTFVDEKLCDKSKPTLLLVDSKEEYENAGVKDPKSDFYKPGAIVQSVVVSTIIDQKANKKGTELQPLIATWVKELVIKLECARKKFIIQEFNDNFWFVRIDDKDKKKQEPIVHILKCSNGNFEYERHDEFYFDELGIELPRRKRFFEDLLYVLDMSSHEPRICSIVHEKIAVIPEADKLFEILSHLERSDLQGMIREFIENFLNVNAVSDDPIIEKLNSMLKQRPNQLEFYKEDLKKAGIGYRSKAEKALVDDYFEKTGIMFNYSLKGGNNDYLDGLIGHFFDADHSAYFSGIEKGGFKFSRGQFNHLRYLDGPEDLKQKCLNLTKSYYIRNKLATVVPFPFKYLNQCIEDQKQMGVSDSI